MTLMSDFQIVKALLDPYRAPTPENIEYILALRKHIYIYLRRIRLYFMGSQVDMAGLTENMFIDEMIRQYEAVSESWLLLRITQHGAITSFTTSEKISLCRKSPIIEWRLPNVEILDVYAQSRALE